VGIPAETRSPLCDTLAERPLLAQDFICKYDFDCRGLTGENVVSPDLDFAVENDIIARCRRTLLRVEPVPKPSRRGRPDGRAHAKIGYQGTTSQGKSVRFATSRDFVHRLRVAVAFGCTDGTAQYFRRNPLDLLPIDPEQLNKEDVGPFPAIPITRHRFRQTFEAPSQTALYEISGRRTGGRWEGTFRVIEGWTLGGNLEVLRYPDPRGEVVCDSGALTFQATRR
jgi:hypothetical protein